MLIAIKQSPTGRRHSISANWFHNDTRNKSWRHIKIRYINGYMTYISHILLARQGSMYASHVETHPHRTCASRHFGLPLLQHPSARCLARISKRFLA